MRADAFLPVGFGDPADRLRRVESAAKRRVSPELLAELYTQSAALPASVAREAHLSSLAGPSAVVATGQQVGLFLGPLYTVYKAASAVVLARTLTVETGIPCVPLFWLQTEDHDFAEIAHCRMTAGEPVELQIANDEASVHERASVAKRRLPDAITLQLDLLAEALLPKPHGAEVMALLRRHYVPGATWPEAFAGVLASLFVDEGLVIFDPRRPVPARLSRPILARAIAESAQIDTALTERGAALEQAGLDQQIRLRPGSPLVFFHPHGAEGPRHRMVAVSDDEWSCPEAGMLRRPDLEAALASDPLRFSTSALLRPIVQDALFPTAAYVGGPAEVSYFAQLAPLYPLFGLEVPLVVPRARFRLVPVAARRLCDELGLSPSDLDRPDDALWAKLGAALPSVDAWTAELEARLATVGDPDLARAVERTRFSVRRAVERLLKRQRHLILEREETQRVRLSHLARWLKPDGEPQERVYGFAGFASLVSCKTLIASIVGAVHPFDPASQDLTP